MHIPSNVNTNCGIYRIKNMRNGKCYIGSSSKLSTREYNHFNNLKNGKHHCSHLQNAYNKEEDKSVFKFQIFIYCKEEDLFLLEQKCFEIMKPDYNSSLVAGRPTPFKFWKAEKQQELRDRARKRCLSSENPMNKKEARKKSSLSHIEYEKRISSEAKISRRIKRSASQKEAWFLNEERKIKARDLLKNCNPFSKLPEEKRKETSKKAAETKIKNGTTWKGDRNPNRNPERRLKIRGAGNCNSKLTDLDVINILLSAEKTSQIVVDFKISKYTVYDILKGRTWKHIPRDKESLEKLKGQ